MEFRQIRYFLEIHRAGSYVRAAGNLGLTQPALSRQISLLERELDARLFERGARSLRLTPQGVTFLDYAVRLDDLWREAYEVLNQDHSRQLMGEYSISTGGTVAAWILPEALNKIRKQFPDVSFRLYEGDASETRESLLRGEVDLGILTGPAREGGLIQKPFLTDRIVPVAARNHPVFRKKKIAMKDLALMDFVFFHPASAIRGVVDAGLRRLRFQPRIVMELRSVESVIKSIEAGHGIGFISALSVTSALREVRIPGIDLTVERKFYFSYRKHHRAGLPLLIDSLEQFAPSSGAK